MRKLLQAGTWRHQIGWLAFGAGVFALTYFWDWWATSKIKPLDAAQKVAFVAAAFSVTAYNLRTRVIDLVAKLELSPARVNECCAVVRACGPKLTTLVILFTTTALLMAAGGFIPDTCAAASWFAGGVAGLFAMSVVHFIYVLFAFERLERFMLDDIQARAEIKEAKRLVDKKSD